MTSIDFQKLLRAAKTKQPPPQKPKVTTTEKEKAQDTTTNSNNNTKNVLNEEEMVTSNLIDLFPSTTKFNFLESTGFKVGTIPNVYYVPDFITKEEEVWLLDQIYAPQYSFSWHQLKKRRLQNWGGTPQATGMIEEPLPLWTKLVAKRLKNANIFHKKPNHALVNEYEGDQGIMHHKDGPIYFPRVAILSLNGSAILSFKKQLSLDPEEEVFLLPRSLLIFEELAYTTYFHGIDQLLNDTISLKTVNRSMVKERIEINSDIGQDLEKDIDISEGIGKVYPRTIRTSITVRIVPTKQEMEELEKKS
jgi:alkylated DNA repair protein alkB family protein 6